MATSELDVRSMRKPDKHPAIFQAFDALAVGESFVLVNNHDPRHLRTLREIADAPFFRMIRGVAVVGIYDDHETWEQLGYEGPSFELGGYLHRGFDDLDWRAEPYDKWRA